MVFSRQRGGAWQECELLPNEGCLLGLAVGELEEASRESEAFLSLQVPFTKDCGSDDVCTSDLTLMVHTDTEASR